MEGTLPTPELHVRAATADDIPTIVTLHARCFEQPWDAAFIADVVTAQDVALVGSWCRLDNGFILIRCAADEAEVLSVGVEPACQQRGMGRALMREGLAAAAARGGRRAFLEVAERNTAAIGLYVAAGFRAVGRRPRYYRLEDGRRIDALILARTL